MVLYSILIDQAYACYNLHAFVAIGEWITAINAIEEEVPADRS